MVVDGDDDVNDDDDFTYVTACCKMAGEPLLHAVAKHVMKKDSACITACHIICLYHSLPHHLPVSQPATSSACMTACHIICLYHSL
jgi:hypothetical protein